MPLGFAALRVPISPGSAKAQGSAERTAEIPAADDSFLELSRAITGHDDLDPTTATRLSAAFARTDPALQAQLHTLGTLKRDGQDASAFLKAAEAAGLGTAAMALVAAWYTGTVGSGPKAEMVAYAEALMYRPVRDAMAPPTYCLEGPAWWTASPPVVGVSQPARPTIAPPTVGKPEPKTP